MTPDIDQSVRCSVSSCSCACFQPGNGRLRSCDRCGHGWVAHALQKLRAQPPSSCGPVEVALPGLVFDLSSLVLYGAQAVPVRLKILLDRLYSVLTPEQVSHILHTLGWSLGDYVRGYMLQGHQLVFLSGVTYTGARSSATKFPSGKVLDRWLMVTREEELLILKQFLRFGETRPIVELMTLQGFAAVGHLSDPESCQPNVGTLAERSGRSPGDLRSTTGASRPASGFSRSDKNSPAGHGAVQHLKSFPGRLSLLLPVAFPGSEVHCLVPSTRELVPPSKPAQYLQKPSGAKPTERHGQDGGGRVHENDATLPRPKAELALKIKVDPDTPGPAQPLWHRHHRLHNSQHHDLHRGATKSEVTSPLCPALGSSLSPSSSRSSSLYPAISSSTSSALKTSQRFQDSSFPSFHALPSFSSSFLCPPSSPFSSTLQPLPSSLCSLPSSPAAGRKGRVCCGVCGKSFYDKGTLKIHYNAVHLKIKHRCTVAGCAMVFSSLRSRNRHSANPNPRLHTHVHRNPETHAHEAKQARSSAHARACRGKKVCSARWQQGEDGHTWRDASPAPSPLPLPQTLSQDGLQSFTRNDSTYRSPLQPQATPPPVLPPARRASSPCSPPSSVRLAVPVAEKPKRCPPLLWESGDSVPKKKPRKSSMPVKIERDGLERR